MATQTMLGRMREGRPAHPAGITLMPIDQAGGLWGEAVLTTLVNKDLKRTCAQTSLGTLRKPSADADARKQGGWSG